MHPQVGARIRFCAWSYTTCRHAPPDLNPVELFWSWLKKKLREMDLEDLRGGRPPITKSGMKRRVRALLRKPETKRIAQNMFDKLRSKCVELARRGGDAIRG